MSKRLYLIDGSSYIYRAYFAIKQFLSNSKGVPTNALYGFALMLMKIIKTENPDYLAIVFDMKGKTHRHDLYPDYKAHRPPMPEDLSKQIPYIKELVTAFSIYSIEKQGFEADDIIGLLCQRGEKQGFDITIISGDKDLMQLVSENVRMMDTLKNKIYTDKEVREKFGVGPKNVVDILGLMGDRSDNIPGIPGIGEKTARLLIKEFGNIESLIERSDQITKTGLKKKVTEHKDLAILSKKLATIKTDIEIDTNFDEMKLKSPNVDILAKALKEFEFLKLVKEITVKSDRSNKKYKLITNKDDFENLLNEIKSQTVISIDTETTHREPVRARICGISFAFKENEAYYIPYAHELGEKEEQLSESYVLQHLKPILESTVIKKVGQNIKYEIVVFANIGINLKGIIFDTIIASYLLNPSRNSHSLDALSLEFLNYKKISYKDVCGEGAKEICFSKVDLKSASDYSSEDADTTLLLYNLLKEKLINENLYDLYILVELPLVSVLAQMELNGVSIDDVFLQSMSVELKESLDHIISKVYELAGVEFNINSPKQLAEILFEKIGLKPVKKKKTGYSTDVSVLEKLADVHPLPAKLLEYRQLAKLKSTYVDALIKIINPDTKRVHTSFNQTITATGRLSSSNPNLQNIPVKTDVGKKIRNAFTGKADNLILSADYSQVELRILAHMAEDTNLIKAFKNGEDIHAKTASEIMGILPLMVTKDMRRIAKSINFGIIYGISAYGLSRDLKIPRQDAKDYIDSYFTRYPKIRSFIDKTVSFAYDKGYVKTLYGRKRLLPELKSTNKNIVEFAERAAVNTVIQGTAADIIKLSMINIQKELEEKKLSSKMILQVHDELVFEVEKKDIDIVKHLVRLSMENAVELKVPLTVDMDVGINWADAH